MVAWHRFFYIGFSIEYFILGGFQKMQMKLLTSIVIILLIKVNQVCKF